VFGLFTVVHNVLEFSMTMELLTHGCRNVTPVHAVRPVLQLAFTSIQLYFIFLYSKVCNLCISRLLFLVHIICVGYYRISPKKWSQSTGCSKMISLCPPSLSILLFVCANIVQNWFGSYNRLFEQCFTTSMYFIIAVGFENKLIKFLNRKQVYPHQILTLLAYTVQ